MIEQHEADYEKECAAIGLATTTILKCFVAGASVYNTANGPTLRIACGFLSMN